MRTRILICAAAFTLGLNVASGCSTGQQPAPPSAKKIDVVTGFYPLQFVAERVGGPTVSVINLAQPGAEPHDMELKPSQVLQIADSDLVIYLKTFQPELDEAVDQNASEKSLDVTTVVPLEKGQAHEHEGEKPEAEEGLDPHVWLDPMRLATVGDAVAARFAAADPPHAGDYTANAAKLRADLTTLDGEFAAGLKTCQRREIVTSHAAFGYLVRKYDLEQISLSGLSPEDEPTPQRLIEVTQEAKEHGATTIFFETLVSPKVAETLAREVGATTAVLDPVEGLAQGASQDYLSVMRANLAALKQGLSCS